MTRGITTREPVERGLQRVIRTYPDGRKVITYRLRYANADGTIVSRTIKGTETQARAALARARAEVQQGEHVVVTKKQSRTTFKQAADHWEANATHLKASTRESQKRFINGGRLQPLHDVRMSGMTYERLQQFQTSLDHLAPSTQKQTMRLVKAICADAVKRGLLKSNPCVGLTSIKARKPRVSMPTHEEVEALISRLSMPVPPPEAMAWGDPDPRWALLVETAAFSGLRAGELAGLYVEDFNPFKRSLTVNRSVPTNSGGEDVPKSEAGLRTVDDLEPALCKRLTRLAADRGPKEYLFGWDDHGTSRPYRHMNFYRRVFKPACEALGIDTRFHDLRHFNASLLIEAGLDPVRVAARLGHATPSFTLDTYAHLFRKESTGLGDLIAAKRSAARGEKPKVAARATKKPW